MNGTIDMTSDPSWGYCTGRIEWESYWEYGNTHSLTLTVYGQRTDYNSAALWGDVYVDGVATTLGDQKIPQESSFDEVTISVETDDNGVILTDVSVSIGFYSSDAKQDFWAHATLTGLTIDKPPKSISIETPDGILCSVNKSTVCVGDQIVISITITGAQWEDATISVTGATQVSGMTYTVTGDVYIVVSGVLSGHTISITETGGISVTVYDEITGATYTDGSVVQHYSNITITYKVSTGYEFVSITVNGEAYDAGVSIEVSSDINIVARAKALGLAYIYTDSSFQPFQVYIYNGSEWRMCVPYVYDGTSWGLCV